MCVFFLQKYHLMQKSTFSFIVQYNFKISVLQHWLNLKKILTNKNTDKVKNTVCMCVRRIGVNMCSSFIAKK